MQSTITNGFTDTNCLAGGFFTDADPDYTGKSHSIESTEPPVGNDYATYRAENYDATEGLTCAGTSGCHGDPRIADSSAAIAGGHHGTTVGGYRMLVAGTTVINVGGVRASDFEKALNAAPSIEDAHNVYQAGSGGNTISDFCATCHGIFHGSVENADSAWIRHPTDVAIPNTWEIYTAFTDEWTNDPEAWKNHPLGFTTPTSPSNATAQVTCLSCHRAHGTANNDILRWDYTTVMLAGQPSGSQVTYGCLGCHNSQR
ncbi:MAG: hypothetical protein A2Z47_11940 [Thermodesulfovibrio sp. RBG_19FT_COMBO_42_12]|nr:MAG: hypothetical protein A2Z47_11940 [Thermodesulfovibrio sp. RBG_19FT_COMBO_42_12]